MSLASVIWDALQEWKEERGLNARPAEIHMFGIKVVVDENVPGGTVVFYERPQEE